MNDLVTFVARGAAIIRIDAVFRLSVRTAAAQRLFPLGEALPSTTSAGSCLPLVQSHPGVAGGIHLALSLRLLGYPDQALEQIRASLAGAKEVRHTFSGGFAWDFGTILRHMRREPELTADSARGSMELAPEQGFGLFAFDCLIMDGLARLDGGEDAVEQIRRALAGRLATGNDLVQPFFLTELGRRFAELGRISDAIETLQKALSRMGHTPGSAGGKPRRIASWATCSCNAAPAPSMQRKILTSGPSSRRGSRMRSPWNCAPPLALPGSGATRTSAPRPAIYWHSMGGSPKASTRPICERPRHCSSNYARSTGQAIRRR
jgi:hypothetical protein